ncbi:MAG: succinylglutamate desuccinylase/aspartoacylase family protein [Candidatus Thermoplasmatota archaeon]|nr:succinylglutamate desuccinylase/aspartoacylase family protein [Candidatus Thermoplasmatota archaeon]
MGVGVRGLLVLVTLSVLVLSFPFGEGGDSRDGEDWSYHSSLEISHSLRELSLLHEEAEYTTAQDLLGTRTIDGGKEIPILFIGNRSDKNRPWIMLVGAHHGDEPDSAEAVLAFAHYVLGPGQDSVLPYRIQDRINMAVLPVVNPYGLDQYSRYDENGEDPNRDYPFEAESITPHTDGVPLTTAGAHAVHSLARMYPFSIALSFHTGSEGIFTPWGAENVNNLTPDRNMFGDLGSVLSRASGKRLNHGPANDYGSLGYLRGAFDDHLYGSTFYSQHLPSGEFVLPWSTATATVELISSKTKDESRLGNLDGVFDIGGPDDGIIPMGVRMCLAACELVYPSMDGGVRKADGNCLVNLSFSGASSMSVTEFVLRSGDVRMDGLELEVDAHLILPQYQISGEFALPDPEPEYIADITISFDPTWGEPAPGSDPEIAPQSVLSLTRRDPNMELHFVLEGERPLPGPGETLRIVDIHPSVQEAGRNATMIIDIPPSLGTPLYMAISAAVDWNVETTFIPGALVSCNISSYQFFTPLLEGDALVEAALITDRGNFSASSRMRLYPYVRIMNVLRVAGATDMFRAYIGVDGAISPTTVFYGLSRDPDIDWLEEDWVLPPKGIVAPGYGPINIDLDLSKVGGSVWLRVCCFPGSVDTSQLIHVENEMIVTPPYGRVGGEMLTIGPSLIHMRWNGLLEVTPSLYHVTYTVELHSVLRNTTETQELIWQPLDHMSDDDRKELLSRAISAGMTADEVTGGWIGYRAAPEEDGTYVIRPRITGRARIQGLEPVEFEIEPEVSISFVIGSEEEDEEKNSEFPLDLVILILILILGVFILSVLRKDAHMVKENEEGALSCGKDQHNGMRRDRAPTSRARTYWEAPPPWYGGGFK